MTSNQMLRTVPFAIGFVASLLLLCCDWLGGNGVARANDKVLVDGSFDEWTPADVIATDPEGDATDAFDVTEVSARTRGTVLYLSFDIGTELNLQNGDRDDGTLKLLIELDSGKTFELDFRKRWASFTDTPDQTIPWTELDMATLPTYAAERIELRIDLSRLDVEPGDTIQLQFGGSDSLENSVELSMDESGTGEVEIPPTARQSESDLRLVSMNTLNQGLSDPRRVAAIRRLLNFTDGDVFCFQEERLEESFRDSAADVVPKREGGELSLHWASGCGIATYLPMQPIEMELDRAAAAAIDTKNDGKLVVVSVHFKCCGYAGSIEDQTRVEQAEQLANELRKLREGEFGEELKEAAILVVGDYNLVGSRLPLDKLKAVGLEDRLLVALNNDAATTWRGRPQESFWPGRLDWLTFDHQRLASPQAFLVDTARLSDETLAELGLEREDSTVSDHLMNVSDFRIKD